MTDELSDERNSLRCIVRGFQVTPRKKEKSLMPGAREENASAWRGVNALFMPFEAHRNYRKCGGGGLWESWKYIWVKYENKMGAEMPFKLELGKRK